MRSLAPQRLRAEAGCSRLPPVALGEVGLLAGGGSSWGSAAPGSTAHGAGETEAGQRAVLPNRVRAGCTRQGSAPLIAAWRGPRGRSGHGLTQCQKPLLT